MHDNLFNHVDIVEENTHVPYAAPGSDLDAEAKKYTEALNSVEIDLQLLGIGGNGHIGFNEPGTPFEQETFVVTLAEKTRQDNKRFFNSIDEVPTHAMTMGIANIMNAKSILMLISGAGKADTVVNLLKGEITTDFPASILQFIIHVATSHLLNFKASHHGASLFKICEWFLLLLKSKLVCLTYGPA